MTPGLPTCASAHEPIVHDNPLLGLGNDWPDSFFMHETRGPAAITLAQAAVDVKALQDQLAAAQKAHDQLVADQQAAEAAVKQAEATAQKAAADAKQKQKDATAAAKKAKKAKKSS